MKKEERQSMKHQKRNRKTVPAQDFTEWLLAKNKELTPVELRLADHLVKRMEPWAFESAQKIAEKNGVHRSTIVRFARNLGFQGFPELQETIRETLLKSFSPHVELDIPFSADSPENATLSSVYTHESNNLRKSYEQIDLKALKHTALGLSQAKRVLFFGRRMSYPIALHLSMALRTMRSGVRLAPGAGETTIDNLFDLTPDDYVLIVTLKRYSPEIIRVIRFIEKANVPLTLLTDISPFGDGSATTRMLRVHVGSASIFDSYTALISIGHTLLTMVRQLLPGANERLEQVEKAFLYFYK